MFSCQRGSCWNVSCVAPLCSWKSAAQLLRKSSQLSILVIQLRKHWKMSFPAVDYASCSASERKLALWHSRKSAVWSALRQLLRRSQLSSYSLWRKSAAQLWSMEKVCRAAMIYVASQLSSYSLWRKSAVQLRSMEKVSCPAIVYRESQLSSYGLWRKSAGFGESQLSSYGLWRKSAVQL